MKTIKSSLLLSLLTMVIPLVLNGCYTQFTFVEDEQYASVEPAPAPPIIIIVPVDPIPPIHPIWPIIGPMPIDPPSPPVFNPLPTTAGSISPVNHPPSPFPKRESGYQRPVQSESTPITTVSNPDSRPTGVKRGGR